MYVLYKPFNSFYPSAFKAFKFCVGIVFPHGIQGGWWQEKISCLGCITEAVRCRNFILSGDIDWGCRCAAAWCDLDLLFDLAVVSF